jgi:hypothetical protein
MKTLLLPCNYKTNKDELRKQIKLNGMNPNHWIKRIEIFLHYFKEKQEYEACKKKNKDKDLEFTMIGLAEREKFLGKNTQVRLFKILTSLGILESKKINHFKKGTIEYFSKPHKQTKSYKFTRKHFIKHDIYLSKKEEEFLNNNINVIREVKDIKEEDKIILTENDLFATESIHILKFKKTDIALKDIKEFYSNTNPDFYKKMKGSPMSLVNYFNKKDSELNYRVKDKFGHRLHTKLTNLGSELRHHLYFDDTNHRNTCNRLVSLDIKNSQFYFLSILDEMYTNVFDKKVCNVIKPLIDQHFYTESFSKFKDIVSKGRFYEKIQTSFANKYLISLDRKVIKEAFMKVIFGDFTHYTKNPKKITEIEKEGEYTNSFLSALLRIFREEFPSVFYFLDSVKSLELLDPAVLNRYSNSSFLTQRIEAFFFYGILTPKLKESGLKRFLYIHDSIVCIEKDLESYKSVLESCFSSSSQPRLDISTY